MRGPFILHRESRLSLFPPPHPSSPRAFGTFKLSILPRAFPRAIRGWTIAVAPFASLCSVPRFSHGETSRNGISSRSACSGEHLLLFQTHFPFVEHVGNNFYYRLFKKNPTGFRWLPSSQHASRRSEPVWTAFKVRTTICKKKIHCVLFFTFK